MGPQLQLEVIEVVPVALFKAVQLTAAGCQLAQLPLSCRQLNLQPVSPSLLGSFSFLSLPDLFVKPLCQNAKVSMKPAEQCRAGQGREEMGRAVTC